MSDDNSKPLNIPTPKPYSEDAPKTDELVDAKKKAEALIKDKEVPVSTEPPPPPPSPSTSKVPEIPDQVIRPKKKKLNKKIVGVLFITIFLVASVFAGVKVSQQNQELRSSAAKTCGEPGDNCGPLNPSCCDTWGPNNRRVICDNTRYVCVYRDPIPRQSPSPSPSPEPECTKDGDCPSGECCNYKKCGSCNEPSPPPVLACKEVTRDIDVPTTGDTVNFTCSRQGTMPVDHYEFQYKFGQGGNFIDIQRPQDGKGTTVSKKMDKAGWYEVRCRACPTNNSTQCTGWQQL